MQKWIRFQGEKYLLVENAITTEEAFINGEMGYAAIGEDDLVRRFYSVIGSKDEIEILGDADVRMSIEGMFNMFFDWPIDGSGM